MSEAIYTPVSQQDIQILEANRCWAEDWSKVLAAEGFNPEKVVGVAFKGRIKIGRLEKSLQGKDGISRDAGIYWANLHNVELGDNCVIKSIGGWLSNLKIGREVIIENVGSISCQDRSTFGNGTPIEVLNEGGGRELKITALTSAQVAYLTVLYRDRKELIEKLNRIATEYAESRAGSTATIGDRVQLSNCKQIVNVAIGPAAMVNGAELLREGTIESAGEAPTLVGHGVIAEGFIFQKGSSITDGAMITTSLVGEGSQIGRQFSAENSLFFANSEGFHSETVAYFGGPYSVTHHRSTLMIASMTSFYNAGSGTNQSNHMYKLGPLHQGIMERGVKTGSFSYLLWPSRIGPFSAVLGKHYANFDTGNFPFSYINEEQGKSILVPGMNFFSVGTMRDGEKWPNRDRRRNSEKLDLLIFAVLSPFTAQKMIKAQQILLDLYANSQKVQDYVVYRGIHIKRLLLKTCARYYRLALDKYFGDTLLKRVEKTKPASLKELFRPDPQGADGGGEWIDMSGLLCAQSRVETLVGEINSGRIAEFPSLQAALKEIQAAYEADEWNWFLTNFETVFGTKPQAASTEDLQNFAEAWHKSSHKLINMVLNDAQKEFEGEVRIGFGIDGNSDEDFQQVRGTFEGNEFVKKLQADLEQIERNYEALVRLIK